MNYKAVFLDYMSLAPEELDFSELNNLGLEFSYHDFTNPEDSLKRIAGFDIVLTNKVVIGRDHFLQNPQLKKVVILATGTNNVDLQAAAEFGVSVSNIVDYSTNSVVQQVFALLLALKTSLIPYHHAVQRGDWHDSSFFGLLDYPIDEIAGKTIGIIGYGKIGKAVAQVATAFGMKVLVCKSLSGNVDSVARIDLEKLLRQSDVVSLHCPLTDQSSNLIAKEQLALMKKDAVLLNLARGGVVDELALFEALKNKVIAAAAVDVLSQEPPDDEQILLKESLDNLIITPHIGWASRQARQNLLAQVVEILRKHQVHQTINEVALR